MLRHLWKYVFDPLHDGQAGTVRAQFAAQRCPPSPTPSMRAVMEADAGLAIDRVRDTLSLPRSHLHQLARSFAHAIEEAVAGRTSPLDIRPAHIRRLPSGTETGTYLAMDLGTTLVHVACVSFFGGGLLEVQQLQRTIPETIKRADADTFFAFLADIVVEAMRETGALMLSSMHLGVTWSFRLDQTAISDGTLMNWSNDFHVRDVEGRDVVRLLQRALDKKGLGMKVISIVNDAVSHLVAGAYAPPAPYMEDSSLFDAAKTSNDEMDLATEEEDDDEEAPCLASCVMGSSTNAAYLERTTRVARSGLRSQSLAVATPGSAALPFSPAWNGSCCLPYTPSPHSAAQPSASAFTPSIPFDPQRGALPKLTIVNTEWADLVGVPRSPWDEPLVTSPAITAYPRRSLTARHPTTPLVRGTSNTGGNEVDAGYHEARYAYGKRAFEYCVGTVYLGRIVGRILTAMIGSGELLCRLIESPPSPPPAFTIEQLMAIEGDVTAKRVRVGEVLADCFSLDPATISVVDRQLVQDVAALVSLRAARLYAAAVAALVAQLHRNGMVQLAGFPSSLLEPAATTPRSSLRISMLLPSDSEEEVEEEEEEDEKKHGLAVLGNDHMLWRHMLSEATATTVGMAPSSDVIECATKRAGLVRATSRNPLVSTPGAGWTWSSLCRPTVQLTLPNEAPNGLPPSQPQPDVSGKPLPPPPPALAKLFQPPLLTSSSSSYSASPIDSPMTGPWSSESATRRGSMQSELMDISPASTPSPSPTLPTGQAAALTTPPMSAPSNIRRDVTEAVAEDEHPLSTSQATLTADSPTPTPTPIRSGRTRPRPHLPRISTNTTITTSGCSARTLTNDESTLLRVDGRLLTDVDRRVVGDAFTLSPEALSAEPDLAATFYYRSRSNSERSQNSREDNQVGPGSSSSSSEVPSTPLRGLLSDAALYTRQRRVHCTPIPVPPSSTSLAGQSLTKTDSTNSSSGGSNTAYAAVTIAVDGLLFRHYPNFNARLRAALVELVGPTAASRIRLAPSDETSGCVGAALVALQSVLHRF